MHLWKWGNSFPPKARIIQALMSQLNCLNFSNKRVNTEDQICLAFWLRFVFIHLTDKIKWRGRKNPDEIDHVGQSLQYSRWKGSAGREGLWIQWQTDTRQTWGEKVRWSGERLFGLYHLSGSSSKLPSKRIFELWKEKPHFLMRERILWGSRQIWKIGCWEWHLISKGSLPIIWRRLG